jgi:PKD repeat protein
MEILMKYCTKKRRARRALMALAIAFAPAFASRAVAQMCPVPVNNGCRTTTRFEISSGCTPYLGGNGDLGDYGSIFFDATTPRCMEDAREYLDAKLSVQNLDPRNWQQWLNGAAVYLMTAAALRLGSAHLLTPDLHQKVLQALDDFEYTLGPNGTCTSSSGNSCMDNYSVHAAGAAWAAAYLTITGTTATPNGRTAQYFEKQATDYLGITFSQTESVCLHRIAAAQPYDACTNCLQISDANELRNKIINGEIEVLSLEHTIENPNYGAGLLPLVVIAFKGLKNAGVTYTAPDLDKVIAHGLARTAQLHASGGSACSASWLSNCPRISPPSDCPDSNPYHCVCTAADLTTGTCITDCVTQACRDMGYCPKQLCSDIGIGYSPGMFPLHALLTDPSSPLAGPTGILLPAPSYQFDDFCPSKFSTISGFFHDGRAASYNEIPYIWALVSQPPLGGVSPDTTPPRSYVDVPATGQRMPAGASFFGWAFDSQEWLASLSFTIDGQSFMLQNYGTIGSRPDVCAFFHLDWKPSTCNVGWSFTFVPPAGLAPGSHVLRVTTSDKFGNVSNFDRTFIFDTPPVAGLTSSCTGLSCTFSDASTDDDGIVSWIWSFGDGSTGSGQVVGHSYSTGGTYTVQLTVTDTTGQTQSISRTVTADRPPTASFTVSCAGRSCSFNGNGSSDDHGISAYAWNFGDGTTGSGATASHTYGSSGSFTVTLTVTDTAGQTASTSRTANPNLPPTACFTFTCSQLSCAFSASCSTDDVSITSYFWSFGDSSFGSGVSPSYGYAETGSYTVALTVTDNAGNQRSTSQPVPVCLNDLNLLNQTITTTKIFSACHTLTAGTNFVIGSGGNVTFHAVDQVALGPGFSVSLGGQLKVVVP